jgi:hypothetical protein|tara:strand:+ start:2192 stop:2449 length:258 start_codon:yes stop_codon:yes gene_type:complete
MGSIFNPKPKRDDSAERLQKQLESERAERLALDNQNAADAAEKRKQRYGYSSLMGEGSSYSGFTGSADKQGKKQKTRSLGGGGAV